LNPHGFSAKQLKQTVTLFRNTAQKAGRDPSMLKIYVRANVPLTAQSLPENVRPFLGGSAQQVVQDLDQIRDLNIDQVLFADVASATLDTAIQRMEELQAAIS
jgi:hypothetical protein